MIQENGIIAAPIFTTDVSQTLGVSSNDIGTLCTSERINPAARFKPTRYGTPNDDPNAWKGDGDCGLVPKKITNLADIAALYDGKLNGWIYNKPDGDYWKRLTDFIGYDHKAQFASISCASYATTDETAFPVMLAQLWTTVGTSSSLSFKDIETVGDGYLGVYAKNEAGESFFFTSDHRLSESNVVEVHINWKNRRGVWTIYPVFSSTRRTDGGQMQSGETLYTIPMAKSTIVTVDDFEDLVRVYGFAAIKSGTDDTIVVTITASNQSKTAKNFGNVYWQLKQSSSTQLQTGDISRGPITSFANVAGDSSQSESYEISGSEAAPFINQGFAWIRVYTDIPAIGESMDQVSFFRPISPIM